MEVFESKDGLMQAVIVDKLVAGSSDITYFIFRPTIRDRPFLQGEDYPALVKAWDNKDDAIFDMT